MSNAIYLINQRLDAATKARDGVKDLVAAERLRHAEAMARLDGQLAPLRAEIADLVRSREALMGTTPG